MKNKIIILCFLSVLAIIVLFSIRSRQVQPNLTLFVSPSVATVTIDGKITTKTSLSLPNGKYTINATFPGFEGFTQEVTVSAKNQEVTVMLIPNSVGLQWLVDHPDEANRREGYGSKQADQASQNLQKQLPIISSLPHVDNFYQVDFGRSQQFPNDPNKIALYVKLYSTDGKQQAIDWLTYMGVDVNTTEIIYQDMSAD